MKDLHVYSSFLIGFSLHTSTTTFTKKYKNTPNFKTAVQQIVQTNINANNNTNNIHHTHLKCLTCFQAHDMHKICFDIFAFIHENTHTHTHRIYAIQTPFRNHHENEKTCTQTCFFPFLCYPNMSLFCFFPSRFISLSSFWVKNYFTQQTAK